MLYSAEGGLRGSKLRYGEPFHLVTVGENTGKVWSFTNHSFCHCQSIPQLYTLGAPGLEGCMCECFVGVFPFLFCSITVS